MTDNLHQLAGQMVALFRRAVPLANAEVDDIIQSGTRDTNRIGHQLDHMIGLCCDPAMLVVFNGIIFAGAQFAYVIMQMADKDEGPRGGRGVRAELIPIRVEAVARRPGSPRR